MSKNVYGFTDADGDIAGAEPINDRKQGPVIWLQTSANGCYIPTGCLNEFINGLRGIAKAAETEAGKAASDA
ncbi:hypothetical protein ACFV0Y_16480 [Streptomyces sp. NPDC059569]|uniref:hypothetical protein n=1 Tax=Streptomyces sp. NPDC059569 TaxID=3346869 RepID=UPI0036BF7A6F